jgi:hypothetical protein
MIQIDIIVDGKDAPPAPEAKKLSDRITYVYFLVVESH